MPRRGSKDPFIKTSIPRDAHNKVKKFKIDEGIEHVYKAYRIVINTHPRIEGRY